MSVDFSMSDDPYYFLGFTDGIVSQVQTAEHMSAVMEYVTQSLAYAFEIAMDTTARFNQDSYHHVYEWGNTYGDWRNNQSETVGNPADRLWKLIVTGRGNDRMVSFALLPSKRPVPIEQALLKAGKNGKFVLPDVHVFTWKATVMEYGLPVSIRAGSDGKGFLVFLDDATGKVIFTKKSINTVPGKDKLTGNFTTFFRSWFASVAPTIFESKIKPELEADIIPRDARGRFVKRSGNQKNFGSKELVNVGVRTFESARAEGAALMRKDTTDFLARARAVRMDKYGY